VEDPQELARAGLVQRIVLVKKMLEDSPTITFSRYGFPDRYDSWYSEPQETTAERTIARDVAVVMEE
jgi:hypothetical protein